VTSNNWLVFGGYPKHGADTEVCKKNTTVVIWALPKIYFKTGSSAASAEICECFSSELTLHAIIIAIYFTRRLAVLKVKLN